MGKRSAVIDKNQISFFDILSSAELTEPEVAISMFDGQEYTVFPLKEWMSRLLPEGEFYVLCGGHPLVLCRSEETAPLEMKYRYYTIGNKVYAATGVGKDDDDAEDEFECAEEE